ncbi:MAG: S-layer homology domain-containing protein [Clostridiales bacterium]|jgi:hypothetical protein|nr:S-layer homology domain-containing protein [Clostridiales bacterium]
MKNRFFTLTLALMMCLTYFPLTALAAYEAESNNDYKTATAISLNTPIDASFTNTYRGNALDYDYDWYRITLEQSGSLQLNLRRSSQSILIVEVYGVDTAGALNQIYTRTFDQLINPIEDYTVRDSDMIYIPKGDYYIRLYANMRQEIAADYTVSASYVPCSAGTTELEPNNEYKSASVIGVNTPVESSFTNVYHGNSLDYDYDWYKVTLNKTGTLQLQIKKPPLSNVRFVIYGTDSGSLKELYANNFVEKYNSVEDAVTEISGRMGVSGGDYYIQAFSNMPRDIVSSYTMTVITDAVDAPSSWAASQVNAAINAGLVPQGLQAKYTQAATRAEFCALAATLYETATGQEITGRKTFTDTKDVNVEKLASIGVVSGTNAEGTVFNPDARLTREQAATMLSRLASAIGNPLPKQAATFADNAAISSWAKESVGQMQSAGIMGGIGNNIFSPQGEYTREQSIVTILRLYDVIVVS